MKPTTHDIKTLLMGTGFPTTRPTTPPSASPSYPFNIELTGYFDNATEKSEDKIVEWAYYFDIPLNVCGHCKKAHWLQIYVGKTSVPELPGGLLRNRQRIEANMLAAVRALIKEKHPDWDSYSIGNIEIVLQ